MIQLLTLLVLLPFALLAYGPSDEIISEEVMTIDKAHPAIQDLEIELSNGEVVPLSDFLEQISEENSEDEELAAFGGEVPWPKPPQDNGKEGPQ